MKPYLKAKGNEILDADGRQLAVILPSGASKSEVRRWAQYIVDRENSVRRTENSKRQQSNQS